MELTEEQKQDYNKMDTEQVENELHGLEDILDYIGNIYNKANTDIEKSKPINATVYKLQSDIFESLEKLEDLVNSAIFELEEGSIQRTAREEQEQREHKRHVDDIRNFKG